MIKRKKITVEERLDELTRRIDTLATQLHCGDSEYSVHQLPELKKRLEDLSMRVSMNESELRIHAEAIISLQRVIYPISEAYDLQKIKEDIKRLLKR